MTRIGIGASLIQRIIDDRKKGLTKSSCKGFNYIFSNLFIDDRTLFLHIGPDLLDLILAARDDDKISKFTDKEIYEEALTFGKHLFSI